jgi:hypothetical protein
MTSTLNENRQLSRKVDLFESNREPAGGVGARCQAAVLGSGQPMLRLLQYDFYSDAVGIGPAFPP